ncbi:hypothetical protein LguiA_005112 [Lonicera macranthoides]
MLQWICWVPVSHQHHRNKTDSGSEEFSFFAEAIPVFFYYVGMKNETWGPLELSHSLHFKVNKDALPYGATLHASLATRYLLEYH